MVQTEKNKHARQVSVSRVSRETSAAETGTGRRVVTARRRTDEKECVPAAEQALPPVGQSVETPEITAQEKSEYCPEPEYPEPACEPDCEEPENQEPAAEDDEHIAFSDEVPENDTDAVPECMGEDSAGDVSEDDAQEMLLDMPAGTPLTEEDLLSLCSCPEEIPEDDAEQENEPPISLAVLTEEEINADLAKDERMKSEKSAASQPEAGKWYIPQKWQEISLLRKVIMVLCAALFLFSCLPLFIGVITPGVLPPACIALFFFGCALYWPRIEGCQSLWGNVLIAVVAVCVLAGVTYMAFVSGKMISASGNTLPDNTDEVTVVVLGCKVNGDQPSRMLQARLEKAAEFLLEHPQAHCIVTGGKGPDEDYPEALIMKNYLVNKGVSSMRIIMEDTSTSTLENLINASQLAKRYNCHERFLIVTDRFHQYRALTVANELGVVSYALNVETVWYLAMQYWFREIAAITRDWLVA